LHRRIRTVFDVLKAIALGADGVVIARRDGGAGVRAMRLLRKRPGLPGGIASTDPELIQQMSVSGPRSGSSICTTPGGTDGGMLARLGHVVDSRTARRSDVLCYLSDEPAGEVA